MIQSMPPLHQCLSSANHPPTFPGLRKLLRILSLSAVFFFLDCLLPFIWLIDPISGPSIVSISCGLVPVIAQQTWTEKKKERENYRGFDRLLLIPTGGFTWDSQSGMSLALPIKRNLHPLFFKTPKESYCCFSWISWVFLFLFNAMLLYVPSTLRNFSWERG